jgi:hypothetical protein
MCKRAPTTIVALRGSKEMPAQLSFAQPSSSLLLHARHGNGMTNSREHLTEWLRAKLLQHPSKVKTQLMKRNPKLPWILNETEIPFDETDIPW